MSFSTVHCKSNSSFLIALLFGDKGNELACCYLMCLKACVSHVNIFFLHFSPQNGMVTKDLTRLKTLLAETEVIMSMLLRK